MSITKILSYVGEIIPNQQSSFGHKVNALVALPIIGGGLAYLISYPITSLLSNDGFLEYDRAREIDDYVYKGATVASFFAIAHRCGLFSSK